MAQSRGIRIHQYLDDWLIRAPTKESCHQGTQSLLALCQELGWVVNLQKSELEPKQVFKFVGYQYDLSHGLVKPTQNRWESILQKVQSITASPTCRVRNFMSLIGLLTATEKQVPLGRLHKKSIQWHLKRHWRVPERDSSPKAPSPAPSMVDQGDKCPARPASAPFASCHSNLYRRLKRRLGCSLRRLHSKQHLVSSRKSPSCKLPGTKSCLAGLKKIPALSTRKSSSSCHRQHHSCGIHQQGGRYEVRLTFCPSMATPVLVQSETGCSKGQAHPWSSKCDCRQIVLSGPNHSDRMVPSSGGFLVQIWHLPQVDMFATKYNCKLAQYVSPVPDPNAWAVDALTVSWENLDMYAFPPVSLLGKVVSKLSDHLYKKVILIAPGWPNMPWFWDAMVPLCLPVHPDLVTQPFSKACHRNLTNLNLNAWLQEPRQSRSRASLAQWHHELRLLKEVQPEQSMRQNGPFLSDGVKQVRWTSDLHLSSK